MSFFENHLLIKLIATIFSFKRHPNFIFILLERNQTLFLYYLKCIKFNHLTYKNNVKPKSANHFSFPYKLEVDLCEMILPQKKTSQEAGALCNYVGTIAVDRM